MENLKPTLEYIINQFNSDCEDDLYRKKMEKRLQSLKHQMEFVSQKNGMVTAVCKPNPLNWTIDGNYKITISSSKFWCSCKGFLTSAKENKKPCKHLIFVACSVALHMAKQ